MTRAALAFAQRGLTMGGKGTNRMKRLLSLVRYWLGIRPSWRDCSKASCWQGANAGTRHMNILSHHFTDAVFQERVKWAEKRGCNCLHLFIVNKGDGEGAGFTALEPGHAAVMDCRIKWAAKRGMGIVLWCMADDSAAWARKLDMAKLMEVCKKRGWLKIASTVCVGLEVDEYWSAAQISAHIATIRRYYKGKVGVHHSHGTAYAHLADVVFYQTDPGKTPAQVKEAVKKALACGKPVNAFELSRHEDRALAQAALDAGAYGVGNW